MKKYAFSSLLVLSCGAFLVATPIHAMTASVGLERNTSGSPFILAASDAAAQAQSFINDMADRGIGFLGDQHLSQEQRKEKFRSLLRSSYDMQTIGRFALGTYWRTATPKQQADFQKLFESMVVEVYSQRFGQYNGQKLDVRGAEQQAEGDTIVHSVILPQNGGDEVPVDWRVRSESGQPKVIDVIVAGVSMALTQRSDFASVIQRGGGNLDALLTQMRNGQVTAATPDRATAK